MLVTFWYKTDFVTEKFGSSDIAVKGKTFACLNDASDGARFTVKGDPVATYEIPVLSNSIGAFTRCNLPAR